MIHKRLTVLMAVLCLVAILASSQPSSLNDSEEETHHEVSALVMINGADDETVDFGFFIPSGIIGDFLWNDLDKDGLQDGGEEGIAGINVSLYDATTHKFINSTTSNDTGFYTFEVPCGRYIVVAGVDQKDGEGCLDLPEYFCDWCPTTVEAGRIDMDSNEHDGAFVVLQKDECVNTTIDFGYMWCC